MYITSESILTSPAQIFIFFLDKNNKVILGEDKEALFDMFPSLRYTCTKEILVKNPVYSILTLRNLSDLDKYLQIYANIAVYVPSDVSEVELFKYKDIGNLYFHVGNRQYTNLICLYNIMKENNASARI
jgi:hypothetical protein